jgi:hypothetical protein
MKNLLKTWLIKLEDVKENKWQLSIIRICLITLPNKLRVRLAKC